MTLSFTTSTQEIQRGRSPKPIPAYVQTAVNKALASKTGVVESTGSAAEIKEAASAFRRFRDQHKDEYAITISPRDEGTRLLVEVKKVEPDGVRDVGVPSARKSQ